MDPKGEDEDDDMAAAVTGAETRGRSHSVKKPGDSRSCVVRVQQAVSLASGSAELGAGVRYSVFFVQRAHIG